MFLQKEPINLIEFFAHIPGSGDGASSFFVGTVRNHHQGKAVEKLFYEAFEPLAEKEIGKIIQSVKTQFGVSHIELRHRLGPLSVGEAAVAIRVHAPHRDEAFKACRAVIDTLKQTVPIWKHEFYSDGTHQWVYCSHTNVPPAELAQPFDTTGT